VATILFADDNRNIRDFCRRELEEEGYRVIAAGDGAEAVRLADSQAPDLVVLDVRMPGVSGLEAMTRIRAANPHMPVVFFTSNANFCAPDQQLGAATACVEKCEDLTELKHAIQMLLRTRQHNSSAIGGCRPGPVRTPRGVRQPLEQLAWPWRASRGSSHGRT